MWVEPMQPQVLVCQSDSLYPDSHPHGNIPLWVEHKTRHTQSVRQFPSRQPCTRMGTLPHGLSTKPGMLGLLDGLHLDIATHREQYMLVEHNHSITLLLVEHTTTAYLVCQSDSLRLDSHSHGNITRWVGHTIRHTKTVNRPFTSHMRTLLCVEHTTRHT